MRLLLHSPLTPTDCAERLRAAIAEPGVRQIADHEGEWPVYGRASNQRFYLGAIERRFGVQGRSRLSALGQLNGRLSPVEGGEGAWIHLESERPRRFRWAAVLVLVVILPVFLSALPSIMAAWGERDLQRLGFYAFVLLAEAFFVALFLGRKGFGGVAEEDRALVDCVRAVCEAEVAGEGEIGSETESVGEGEAGDLEKGWTNASRERAAGEGTDT